MVDRLVSAGRVEREATAEAMRAVPRHEFVPPGRRDAAYEDRPLPIGEGQTVSAPHMVGVMCDLLAPDADDEVLEIGTGCGYHAAVTAELVDRGTLYSVEYHESLAEEAREALAGLGYGNVEIRAGDGHEGWSENAPYDGAYLTCAAPTVPDAVLEQVGVGGTVVAPVGDRRQELVTLDVTPDGGDRERHGGVRFVPMRGE
nr:protein-L-isoaspartate(D-aspartate) O-methyltransferase [Halobaculum salinum]